MNFHNSKIMKFMRLIHAKSVEYWWGLTSVIDYLIDFDLLCDTCDYSILIC